VKREQDEEGRTCRIIRIQIGMVHIIINKEPFDLPLESVDDNSLPNHLHHLYHDAYDHAIYDVWPINRHFPKDFE